MKVEMEEARSCCVTSLHMAGVAFFPRPEEVVYDLRMVVMRARGMALGSVQEAPLKASTMVAVLWES